MGIAVGERKVIIEDPEVGRLIQSYCKARDGGDAAKAASLREQILKKRYNRAIAPGQAVPVDKINYKNRGSKNGFAATVRMYPQKDNLRVVMDVLDKDCALGATKKPDCKSACLCVYICPGGVDDEINYIVITPDPNTDGKAVVPEYESSYKDKIDASWKRTVEGYRAEMVIPWSNVKGYYKGWKLLPIEVMTIPPGSYSYSQLMMNKAANCWESPRSYAVLKASGN